MPVRGVVFPEMHQFGFVERLYVHLHLPEITRLQNVGLSAREIAADMNALTGRPSHLAVLGMPTG
jgi:hypothetical protein